MVVDGFLSIFVVIRLLSSRLWTLRVTSKSLQTYFTGASLTVRSFSAAFHAVKFVNRNSINSRDVFSCVSEMSFALIQLLLVVSRHRYGIVCHYVTLFSYLSVFCSLKASVLVGC